MDLYSSKRIMHYKLDVKERWRDCIVYTYTCIISTIDYMLYK